MVVLNMIVMSKGKVLKRNIGVRVTSFDQLDTLIKNKKSVVWKNNRVPAAIIQNQQYRVVVDLIGKGKLNVYIKNKV